MRRLAALVCFVLVLAAGPAAAVEARPVTIAGAQAFDMTSSVDGNRLRVLVWQPPGPVPENGFPVLYTFDGDESFGLMSDLAAGLAPAARRSGLDPAMLVAIGYRDGEGSPDRRTYDLTPAAERHVMPERPNGQPWPKLGGGDDLLAFIEHDVKLLIRERFRADETQETLFGHSLGGLMVLRAITTKPHLFERYVSSSPSMWVNDRQALRDMDAFLDLHEHSGRPLVLRLTVGTEEEKLSAWDLLGGEDPARQRWMENNRMVGNARDLADLIETHDHEGVDFRFDILDGFDHGTARAVAAQRALKLAIDGR